jgi:hypothetical protein
MVVLEMHIVLFFLETFLLLSMVSNFKTDQNEYTRKIRLFYFILQFCNRVEVRMKINHIMMQETY